MELQLIDPAVIVGHAANPRRELGPLTELTASIKAKGILEPLVVAGSDVAGFVLIAGHRRLEAARKAKLQSVPCIVRADLDSPQAQLEAMLVENLQRSDLTAVEEAEAYQALLTFPDYTIESIVKTTGRSLKTVKSRLLIGGMPDKVKAKIHGGQMSLADVAKLAPFSDEPEVVEYLATQLGGYNFQYTLQAAKRRATEMRKARDAGATVVTTLAEGEDLEARNDIDVWRLPYDTEPAAGQILYFAPNTSYATTYSTTPPVESDPNDLDIDRLETAAGEQPIVDAYLPGDAPPTPAGPARKAGGSMVQKKAEKAGRQRRESEAEKAKVLTEQLATASDARMSAIVDVVRGRDIPVMKMDHAAATALRFAIGEILDQYGADELDAHLFGVDLAPALTISRRIMDATQVMDAPHLALAIAAMMGGQQQTDLRRADNWPPRPTHKRWLDLCEDVYGYQLSDIERNLIESAEL